MQIKKEKGQKRRISYKRSFFQKTGKTYKKYGDIFLEKKVKGKRKNSFV
jgi:hypothetical protein